MNIVDIYAKVIPQWSKNCVARPLLLLLFFPKPTTSKLNARIDPVTLNKSSSNWRGPSQVLLYNSTNDDGNGNDEN